MAGFLNRRSGQASGESASQVAAQKEYERLSEERRRLLGSYHLSMDERIWSYANLKAQWFELRAASVGFVAKSRDDERGIDIDDAFLAADDALNETTNELDAMSMTAGQRRDLKTISSASSADGLRSILSRNDAAASYQRKHRELERNAKELERAGARLDAQSGIDWLFED